MLSTLALGSHMKQRRIPDVVDLVDLDRRVGMHRRGRV
jgi:hypothetical protein